MAFSFFSTPFPNLLTELSEEGPFFKKMLFNFPRRPVLFVFLGGRSIVFFSIAFPPEIDLIQPLLQY